MYIIGIYSYFIWIHEKIYGKICMFEYMKRPLTPSFVGSNPATPARKGKFGQKRAQICSFFAFQPKKTQFLNVQCWELGSKLGSFWEVKSHV